jgi:hypothetical protein
VSRDGYIRSDNLQNDDDKMEFNVFEIRDSSYPSTEMDRASKQNSR